MIPDEAVGVAAMVSTLVVVGLVSWRLGWASGFRKATLDHPRPALRVNKEWNK